MNLVNYMTRNKRVLLVGPPGCAKTARVLEAAKTCGRQLIARRASLAERVDFGGCLVPDVAAGVTRSLPLDLLAQLRTTKEPTLLFLDDLGQAPLDVQSALMLLFDAGELSDSVLIWGATNRPKDKAGVSALCEPLRSRFHLAFNIAVPDSEETTDGGTYLQRWAPEQPGGPSELTDWVNWAMDAYPKAPEAIAWHRSTSGRTLYLWKPHADPATRMPDFRAWETVLDLWTGGIRDLHSISAAIGKPTASEFLAFALLADKLPTPDQVRMDPHGAPVPEESAALYLVCTMLAAAAGKEDAEPFASYLARLPRVHGALLGRDLYRRLGAALSGSKAWSRWFIENQALFNTTGSK